MPTDFQPTWALIKKPAGYPTTPQSGKIQMIYSTNATSLYHRFSPYSNYSENTGFLTWGTQPFYYIYPDQNNQGLNALKKYEDSMYPIGDAPIDVIRVSKFLISGAGIGFLAKQFLLQTGNAYNETRIYNPTSPIVAAGMTLAAGFVRPQRNFDTSGGLAGIVGSLVGSTIQTSIFGAPKVNPPSGTTGTKALPYVNLTSGGKGLLRAQTANTGKGLLEGRWGQPSNAPGFLSSLFSNFIPQNQNGITYRSDEGAYGLMVIDKKALLSYEDVNGAPVDFSQIWVAGAKVMRKKGEYPPDAVRNFVDANGNIVALKISQLASVANKLGTGYDTVGYSIQLTTDKPIKYGDYVGTEISNRNSERFSDSDMMVQYNYYADPNNNYPTKQTDPVTVQNMALANNYKYQLQRVLDEINATSNNLYTIDVPPTSRVISSNNSTVEGYNRLFATAKNSDSGIPSQYALGFLQDYRNNGVSVVSNDLTSNVKDHSKKLPTNGWFDAINTLQVLGKDKKINNSKLKSWDEWDPYKDDLIALYFYDVVNEKYIPFRAAIKGLSESSNASWEEMPFIGRGDKVYSYGGFNRNLTVTINIVISSLVELAPTWQRINYLTTLVKPANYTTSKYNGSMNRFMVPPMVMLTLGDMYKDQPVLIQSTTTTIPDDAIWETQHQIGGEQWKYLADYMKAPASVLFGQLPRTIDITLSLILLEKERAMVGGANFGHAPRDENLQYWNTDTVPNGGIPTKLHGSWVVAPNGKPVQSKDEIAAQYQ